MTRSIIRIVLVYLVAMFLMGSFNIVETVLPYYTKSFPIYEYVKLSISLIYFVLAFSNIVSIYFIRRLNLSTLLFLGVSGYLLYTLSSYFLNPISLIVSGIFLGFTASIYWLTTRLFIYYEVPRNMLGRAFGILNCIVLISSGVFPFTSLALFNTLRDSILLALCLYLPIMIILILLSMRSPSFRLVEQNVNGLRSIFKEFSDSLRLRIVKLLIILAFSNSYVLPLIVMYSPLISRSGIELAYIRLLSYALPGLVSLVGGFLYDIFREKVLLSILIIVVLVQLVNVNPVIILGLIVLIQNMFGPSLNAHIGRIVPRDLLDKVLPVLGLIGTLAVSFNMYMIPTLTQFSCLYTRIYLTLLSLIASIVTMMLVLESRRVLQGSNFSR